MWEPGKKLEDFDRVSKSMISLDGKLFTAMQAMLTKAGEKARIVIGDISRAMTAAK